MTVAWVDGVGPFDVHDHVRQEDTREMPVHLKVLADRGMYDRGRRALRPWAILIVRYLSGKRGAKQATIREIGRVVFEGSANRDYRALVQSLLVDYLGLSKTGRETRTLVGALYAPLICALAPLVETDQRAGAARSLAAAAAKDTCGKSCSPGELRAKVPASDESLGSTSVSGVPTESMTKMFESVQLMVNMLPDISEKMNTLTQRFEEEQGRSKAKFDSLQEAYSKLRQENSGSNLDEAGSMGSHGNTPNDECQEEEGTNPYEYESLSLNKREEEEKE